MAYITERRTTNIRFVQSFTEKGFQYKFQNFKKDFSVIKAQAIRILTQSWHFRCGTQLIEIVCR